MYSHRDDGNKKKKLGDSVKHRAKSIFLHGLEYLKSILSNVEHKIDEFLEMVELFGMYLNRINFEPRKVII